MSHLVIYHGRCIDGFTAAWAAWRKFGDAAEYVPAMYGAPAPDVTGRDVLIVDFSYPRATLLEMASKAKSIRVFDHHKTAQADLDDLNFCVFDMNRSGAGITWDELHDRERPLLVNYVEDRDLWRFELQDSKAMNAFIGSYEQTWHSWEALDFMLRGSNVAGLDTVKSGGRAIMRMVDRYVREMAEQARMLTIGEWRVPVVNAPYINTSELVGYLAEKHPDHPFAAAWYQRFDGLYAYSLRSRGDFDVSAVAKQFGGGGHRNAAGFTVINRVDSGELP